MIHSTRGIVLRTIKYGETSIIASVFTEIFGIQSYLVNGVRTQSKTVKAHFFQPSSLLELQVYHNELKSLQRIKEMKWSTLYKNILSDVTKNAVALFMVEILYKCLKHPEENNRLFHFCEEAFLQLDVSSDEVTANFALYFSLQLSRFFGFQILDNYSDINNVFNSREGIFSKEEEVQASDYLNKGASYHLSQLLKVKQPAELGKIKMNRWDRRILLKNIESYYEWHVPEFGTLKTLVVLQEII